jgi:transposase
MRLETPEAQEFRLHQIYQLDQKGYSQTEIAELTDCTQAWVSIVLKRVEEEGIESLQAKESKAGNKPALDEDDLTDLEKVLEREARASGFETDGWTRKRVAQVIEQRYGVRHHPSHVSRILAKIGFSRQKMQGKHYRKDEQASRKWREETLPELKKKP